MGAIPKSWTVVVIAGALGVLALLGGVQAALAASVPVDPPVGVTSAGPGVPPDLAPTGETYHYMAIVPPGRPVPDWAGYGRVLWQEGAQALLAATPAGAERLAAAGVEIALVSPEPPAASAGQTAASAAMALPTSPDPVIQGMIDQVTGAAVATYDRQLSGDLPITVDGSSYTLTTRRTDSGEPILKATQFVGDHLAALGYDVEYHPWSSAGYAGRNVIGELPGQIAPEDIFIIGAHLDDVAYLSPAGPPDPGADDNATGSAAVLAAADILSQYYWGCTLRLALWTGEEQGILGSAAYAARAHSQGERIQGYLNLDMVGYNGAGNLAPREVNLFWKSTVPASEQIADMFVSVNSLYGLGLIPFKYDAANSAYQIGNYSDNRSFWDQAYPALLAIEDYFGDFTPYYHTTNDLYSTLDLDYFTRMVKAAVGAFVHMTGCLISDAPIRVTPSLPGSGAVALHWYHTAPNSTYQVWRSLDPGKPYFTPGAGDCEALDPALAAPNLGISLDYPDAAAAVAPGHNRYYLVQGMDGAGGVAAISQRVGAFSFVLAPGAVEP